MNQEHPWDACRYVLEDPTLDRQAFEQRMLDDVELAMAVAEAVSQVELMQAAARRCQLPLAIPSLDASVPERTGLRWQSVAALAAALLLAIGLFSYGLIRSTQRHDNPTLAEQRILAQHWLALYESDPKLESISQRQMRQQPALSAEPTSLAMIDHGESSWAESDWPTSSEAQAEPAVAAEDDDWLIDAARQYYAQSTSSGAAS